MKITVLGARGSVATDGTDMTKYGGATSCILVEAGNEAVFLDAGTGIVHAPDLGDKHISILITHPHIDHIVGLPFFPYITEQDRQIDIYAVPRLGLDTASLLKKLFSPPLWPLAPEDYRSDLRCHDIGSAFSIGNIGIDLTEATHPGGVSVFRISYEGKSFVYATDCEPDEKEVNTLAEFSRDTDLIFFDAQYTEEEYKWRKGYGHSTIEAGIKVKELSGARKLRFIHHDPFHTDEMVDRMEKEIKEDETAFAREGEVIIL